MACTIKGGNTPERSQSRCYTVIRFIAGNPGWWLLHCHVLHHQLEGMTVVVKELQGVNYSS